VSLMSSTKIERPEVPDMLKPAYSFGGLSLSQMIKPNDATTEKSEVAGAPEIEITPAMIEAGILVLFDTDYVHDRTLSSRAVVAALLDAALSSAGFCVKIPSNF